MIAKQKRKKIHPAQENFMWKNQDDSKAEFHYENDGVKQYWSINNIGKLKYPSVF